MYQPHLGAVDYVNHLQVDYIWIEVVTNKHVEISKLQLTTSRLTFSETPYSNKPPSTQIPAQWPPWINYIQVSLQLINHLRIVHLQLQYIKVHFPNASLTVSTSINTLASSQIVHLQHHSIQVDFSTHIINFSSCTSKVVILTTYHRISIWLWLWYQKSSLSSHTPGLWVHFSDCLLSIFIYLLDYTVIPLAARITIFVYNNRHRYYDLHI